MKKLLALVAVVLGVSGYAGAIDTNLTAEPQVIHTAGPLQIYNPLLSPRAVYYFDLRHKENMVGGELPIFKLYILEGAFGLATNVVDPNGANPVIGANIALPNPIPAWAALDAIKPGVFTGWNMQKAEAIFGLKAAVAFGS